MICIILGTRPEIIKMSPIIRVCEQRGLDYFILHTGQHYTFEMDRAFFEDLDLPKPQFNLDVGSGSHARQTGRIMVGIEKILRKMKPDSVLVQGDTNTVLAGALCASKLHISVGHVEAGLRSFDKTMPEEINRIVADHISDFLFVPTQIAKENVLNEGIDESKIFLTGNTVVDAVLQNIEISKKKANILKKMGINAKEYFVATAHRSENVDSRSRLKGILQGLELLTAIYDLPVIFPIHPRTEKMLRRFVFAPNGIRIVQPLRYIDFLHLEANARLILTDSGGVQEESCILHVPCVTMRDNTERPETIQIGINILAGTNKDAILNATKTMMCRDLTYANPYGDGKAGQKILYILEGI